MPEAASSASVMGSYGESAGAPTSPWRMRMFFMPGLRSAVKPCSSGPLRFSVKAAP